MFNSSDQELTADQVKELLGRPPLMPGESEEEWWRWWTASVEPDKPKRFFIWLEANELAHKEWEQRRLRRYGPALVERALVSALSSLLHATGDDGIPSKTAKDYFGKDAKAQREARETIDKWGITYEQIVAMAMVDRRGEEMLILDRMVSNRAGISRHLRKAIERRAETGKIPREQLGDQVLGAPGRAN